MEFIQLTSFGCTIDAGSSNQIQEILQSKSKLFALIKVDDGLNLGAVRIRLRFLLASKNTGNSRGATQLSAFQPTIYPKAMHKEKWRMLMSQISPLHGRLL
jgi:predicted nucleotide-binding protein (sugar kinase/HSP70/actin superfamily)